MMTNNSSHTSPGILFVDDEDKARKYFQRAFSTEFTVMTAASVDEARAILNKDAENIGILISDQRMPEQTGVQLIRQVKQEHPHIVRILTTAYSDLEDAIDAVNAGQIFRYITKPWDLTNLRGELISALRHYEVQKERDSLIQEKLNIWQQLIRVNHARDLIIMTGALPHLQHTKLAIHAFLTQCTLMEKEQQIHDDRHFDPWILMQQEIASHINDAEQINQKTFFPEIIKFEDSVDVADAIHNVITTAAFTNVEQYRVKANALLVQVLATSLASEFNLSQYNDAKFTLSANLVNSVNNLPDTKGVSITIDVEGVNSPDESVIQASSNLLTAYLITYHHGGSCQVRQSSSNAFQLEVQFPNEAASIPAETLSNQWLDDIFSGYENQGN